MGEIDASRVYKQVASQIGTALAGVDPEDYGDRAPRKVIANLKRLVVDVRLDIRDADMADTRAEMLQHSRDAVKRLNELQQNILLAAEFNVFNPVDVAQLGAQIEQIAVQLKP
jgi:pyruvate/oxaloacetate carboxyltransferase